MEWSELRRLGLTCNDVRWLIRQGLVQHAYEVTVSKDDHRRFVPCPSLNLSKRTCLIVTEKGCRMSRQFAEARDVRPAAAACEPAAVSFAAGPANGNGKGKGAAELLLPRWDRDRRHLLVERGSSRNSRCRRRTKRSSWARSRRSIGRRKSTTPCRPSRALSRNADCTTPSIRSTGGSGIACCILRPTASAAACVGNCCENSVSESSFSREDSCWLCEQSGKILTIACGPDDGHRPAQGGWQPDLPDHRRSGVAGAGRALRALLARAARSRAGAGPRRSMPPLRRGGRFGHRSHARGEHRVMLRRGIAVAAIVVVLDQLSKAAVLAHFADSAVAAERVTPFFNLVLTYNRGMSFGLFDTSTRAAAGSTRRPLLARRCRDCRRTRLLAEQGHQSAPRGRNRHDHRWCAW